jgi:uncharacterized repeat protein (TIGR04138 family)
MAKTTPDDFPADYEQKIRDIVRHDPRYAFEAYTFMFNALEYAQRMVARTRKPEGPMFHVTGRELLEGIRRYAIKQFGLMARTLFETWGARRTEDFGEMVFNLVDGGLMRKTETDTREDFKNVYDFAEAFEGEAEHRKSWRPAD